MEQDPEKLLVTADLHYGLYPDGDGCSARLAELGIEPLREWREALREYVGWLESNH